jgi:hypothetical protein
MKLFNIYIKKSENQAIEDLAVIKNGFSIFAFLFNILWFLQHKMWRESIALIVVNAVFGFVFHRDWFGTLDMFGLEFGLALIIGLNANYWYEQNLLAQKYQFVGCVFGKNRDEAKLRFISNCFKDDEQNNIFCPSIADLKNTRDQQQYFTT